ncbi:Helicase PriA essential for oriC/DnaA-independent DNA replication [gamma proteobacterium IMCC1989]|nr:Helicase PriA essential for oriC/DnaA-independent DNA replication [gamma proteobacterium IMCC1989]
MPALSKNKDHLAPTLLRVAIPSPLRRTFDYLPTKDLINSPLLVPGLRVSVSFGGQKNIVGIVIDADNRLSEHKLKSIHAVLDDEQPTLTSEILALCEWCSRYYHYPLGEVCHLALPTLLRKPSPLPIKEKSFTWQLTTQGRQCNTQNFSRAKKQLAVWEAFVERGALSPEHIKVLDISRTSINALIKKGILEKITDEKPTPNTKTVLNTQNAENPKALTLNSEQKHALDNIHTNTFNCYLLDGVTGSGKTEIYLQTIQKVINKGQQALVLVPEIGLTPQTVSRFQQRFNVPVATLHSGMNDKQRLFAWQDAKAGLTPIIIGTRSSVFTPFPNLGLIIVDEEHDLSYKQQDGVRYSARDTAIVRAQQQNIPIILGSATPALETLHNAISGRFTHLHLTQRATTSQLPDIHCIPSSDDSLSPQVVNAIRQTLAKQQQALVFINRRGFAPTLICQDCHWISECQHCDSRMTLHKLSPTRQILHCHQCDTKNTPPPKCPKCHSKRLQPLGQGTQRSEEELRKLFPETAILRIDRDSMSRKGELANALEIINSEQPCILVGTQMLAKGHHFANVSLAVILGIDSGFFSSDFRGSERMGQLLTQVAGRAGREKHQGTVLLQTEFADHPLLQKLIHHGYSALSQQLLSERRLCDTPPYRHMAFIRCHAFQANSAIQFLQQTRQHCENTLSSSPSLQYLGPLASTIEKRKNRYYYYLQIKATKRSDLHYVLKTLCPILEKQRAPKRLHWLIDVDPQET